MRNGVIVQVTKNSPADSLVKLSALLNKFPSLSFSLIVPLSFLETNDVSNLKHFIDIGRVELINTYAYITDPTNTNETDIQEDIILNEYALGYFFGSKKSFDGDDVSMIKDLNIFALPGFTADSKTFSILNDLGYTAVIINTDSTLSIYEALDFEMVFAGIGKSETVGITNIDIIDEDSFALLSKAVFALKVSSVLPFIEHKKLTEGVAGLGEVKLDKVDIQSSRHSNVSGYEHLPIWDSTKLETLEPEEVRVEVEKFITLHKSFSTS